MWRWWWHEPQDLWVFAEIQVGMIWREQGPCSSIPLAVSWGGWPQCSPPGVSEGSVWERGWLTLAPWSIIKEKADFWETYRKIYLEGCVGPQHWDGGCSRKGCLCGAGSSLGGLLLLLPARVNHPHELIPAFYRTLPLMFFRSFPKLGTIKSEKTWNWVLGVSG